MSCFFKSDPNKVDGIILVDVHNLCYRSAFAPVQKTTDSRGYPNYHYSIMLDKLYSAACFMREYCRSVCIVCSAEENYGRKQKLFPDYKQGRSLNLPVFNVRTKIGVVEKAIDPLSDFHRVMSFFPHCDLSAASGAEETDDILASACLKYSGKSICLISNDRDLWQLRKKNLWIVKKDYPQLTLVSASDVQKEFFNRDSRLIPLFKTLAGDSTDNLYGLKFFPKKKIFPEISYSFYKDGIEHALKRVYRLLSDKFKISLKKEFRRLLKLHSVIRLREDLLIKEYKVKGDRDLFISFLKKRGVKKPKILNLYEV